ncbi:TPA: hypothetical protein RP450_001138 [Acinetobacter baumannii]|uniref:hypothetical protein n=1 Tax=Acinetobacter baumannii TaxID=470 RepID=UPI0002CFB6C7|nr:hypothetical protein [Acinetobacter baumannii]ENW41139.1 hypothetical protein F919_03675 [Acinetobacter baumannii NIPH 329]HDX6158789.1 hypothetical protein [Acinetobacter baumannii]
MKIKESNCEDKFNNIKKKELIALLRNSIKRESDQMLSNWCAISKRDVEIHHLEMQIFDKDLEISRLKKEIKPNNFWLKMSIALGFLLFLSILIHCLN